MMTINGRQVFLFHTDSLEDTRGDHAYWDRFVRLIPLGTRVKGGPTAPIHARPNLRPIGFNAQGQEGVVVGVAESDHNALHVGPTSQVESIQRKMLIQFFESVSVRDIDANDLLYFIGGRWCTVAEVLAFTCPDCRQPVDTCTCWPDEPHDGPHGG